MMQLEISVRRKHHASASGGQRHTEVVGNVGEALRFCMIRIVEAIAEELPVLVAVSAAAVGHAVGVFPGKKPFGGAD